MQPWKTCCRSYVSSCERGQSTSGWGYHRLLDSVRRGLVYIQRRMGPASSPSPLASPLLHRDGSWTQVFRIFLSTRREGRAYLYFIRRGGLDSSFSSLWHGGAFELSLGLSLSRVLGEKPASTANRGARWLNAVQPRIQGCVVSVHSLTLRTPREKCVFFLQCSARSESRDSARRERWEGYVRDG